jgi:hypothetical protein
MRRIPKNFFGYTIHCDSIALFYSMVLILTQKKGVARGAHVLSQILLCCFLTLNFSLIHGQIAPEEDTLNGEIPMLPENKGKGNDTLIVVHLGSMDFLTLRNFENKRSQRRYDRLVERVKRTYPLAKTAASRMEEYALVLEKGKRRDRKVLVKQYETEIRNEHLDKIKRFSFADGRILLRLLDRETRYSAFDLVSELRGKFQAIFWQGVAGLFDYDLKTGFNPSLIEEDRYIDEICIMIDMGLLP